MPDDHDRRRRRLRCGSNRNFSVKEKYLMPYSIQKPVICVLL